ncbi:FGGY family carbohydrate kinase [Cytophagaceae bacterium YF14B1]|uniref:FGGY family carbohydrate kinase n=1 Tax=Xanthocytophaga flava TaxID=3048013 RepID=A0AAE3QP24_9BACT|nr:FGGY family carbohydrate kinase [Xanthocytophaga flavus]MDJ1480083.1 FGGY family carbohydrate kinase [Xanthocytophaga flavus]
MKQPTIAVFDIGKTNKKFFLFDFDFKELHQEYISIPETTDEDGYPCEDLLAVTTWMQQTLNRFLQSDIIEIKRLNFSTYGASFVHLDAQGTPLTPLYNYTKPYPSELLEDFYEKNEGKDTFSVHTASPALGMLNSGLQLYWLRKTKPELFAKVRYSLHFPQYCSYLFTGLAASEYTSVGCHTGLWNFVTRNYHNWVVNEQLDTILPPLVPTTQFTFSELNGHRIRVGTGIHDSSAALLPYIVQNKEPFLLLSTGTWNITFNPFNNEPLTKEELNQDCLLYLQTNGEPVKASRLFLGNEYNYQTQLLATYFQKSPDYFRQVEFDEGIYIKWKDLPEKSFCWQNLQFPDNSIIGADQTDLSVFKSFEEALHRMMIEMIDLQIRSIKLATGSTHIHKLFVDGGFTNSSLFLEMLSRSLPSFEIIATPTPLGSSLGAAMAISI